MCDRWARRSSATKAFNPVMARDAPGQGFDDGEIADLAEQLHVLDRDREQRCRGV